VPAHLVPTGGVELAGLILLITGGRGAGKSTVCREVVALAQAAGYTCSGLLTIPRGSADERSVVDVRTGDLRPLTLPSDGVQQGRYRLDPAALAWGAGVLARAVPCDLLVVDELGPLEIRQRRGWAVALDLLRNGRFRLALIVVRPELVGPMQLLLPVSAPAVVPVTPENRDRLPAELLAVLERETWSS